MQNMSTTSARDRARAGLAALALLASAAAASAGTMVVQVEGVEGNTGQVFVGLCDKSFDETGCPFGTNRPTKPGTMEFTFDNVPPGLYAVAAYHDVNKNGKFDRTKIGLPGEPYAFSNSGSWFDTSWVAPDFQKSRVALQDRASVTIKMKRLPGS